jgi:hypothetical protein
VKIFEGLVKLQVNENKKIYAVCAVLLNDDKDL